METAEEDILKGLIIEKVLTAMKEFDIPGLVLVALGPDFRMKKAFGVTDKKKGTKATNDCVWQTASISKNISATCLLG